MATKINLSLLAVLSIFLMVACSQPAKEETAEKEAPKEEMTTEKAATNMWDAAFTASTITDAPGTPLAAPEGASTMAINTETSKMYWRGTKPTGSHDGTVNISGGQFMIADGAIAGGMVEIDMTTITNTDMAADPEKAGKLEGHLKSPDFFNVAEHPKAMLELTKVEASEEANMYSISGNLTIKGITHEVTFPATVMMEEGAMMAKANLKIDRSKWNITFGSKSFPELLGEVIVDDEMDVVFELSAMPEAASE